MKRIEMMKEICKYSYGNEPELLTTDELIEINSKLKKNWYLSKVELEGKMLLVSKE